MENLYKTPLEFKPKAVPVYFRFSGMIESPEDFFRSEGCRTVFFWHQKFHRFFFRDAYFIGLLRGGGGVPRGGGSLIFPKVPIFPNGILRVPQEHPPFRTLQEYFKKERITSGTPLGPKNFLPSTWRIIPVSKWLITMVSKSPKWGYSPYKWPKWSVKRGY